MPPEYPTNSVKSIFYELLRPELVQSNLTSLNRYQENNNSNIIKE
jgi:hypothetical protein